MAEGLDKNMYIHPIVRYEQVATQSQYFFYAEYSWFVIQFSFSKTGCRSMAKEPSLLSYLPINGGRINWFMPSPRALVQSETHTTSSKIWTQVVKYISSDNNRYARSA